MLSYHARTLLAFSIAALAAPAAAADDVTVAGWQVGEVDGESCVMASDFEGDGETTLGVGLRTDGRVYLSLTNYNWSAVSDRVYNLAFALDGVSYSGGKSVGYVNSSKKGFITTLEPDFLQHFARSAYLTVRSEDGVTIDDLDLAGSAAALAQMRRCVAHLKSVADAEARDKARLAHIPQDPYAVIAGEVSAPAVAPKSQVSLASLVGPDDYPPAAYDNNEQGEVRFRLAVGKDGRVTKCDITQTSGSAVLDHATCRIMQARAKFSPARSADGGPVEGAVEDSVSWSLR